MSQLGLARAWKRRELSYLESLASCASYAAREENRNSLTVVDKWMEAKMLTWFVMGGNDAAMIEMSCPRSSIVGCCCGVAVMDVEVAGVDGETAGYIICLLDYKVERIILWTLYVSMYPKKKKQIDMTCWRLPQISKDKHTHNRWLHLFLSRGAHGSKHERRILWFNRVGTTNHLIILFNLLRLIMIHEWTSLEAYCLLCSFTFHPVVYRSLGSIHAMWTHNCSPEGPGPGPGNWSFASQQGSALSLGNVAAIVACMV